MPMGAQSEGEYHEPNDPGFHQFLRLNRILAQSRSQQAPDGLRAVALGSSSTGLPERVVVSLKITIMHFSTCRQGHESKWSEASPLSGCNHHEELAWFKSDGVAKSPAASEGLERSDSWRP